MLLPEPIFILGVQRSGTTLLTRILSAHKNIFIQNELPLKKIFNSGESKKQITDKIFTEINIKSKFKLQDQLINGEIQAWGIKDPQLLEHQNKLAFFLKSSKFIIIIRDCRGTVNSLLKNKWGQGTTPYTAAQKWLSEVEQQQKLMRKVPKNFLLIKYESLLEDIEGTSRKLCSFLSVPFSPDMIRYYCKNANFNITPQNVNTNQKPDISIANQWQDDLSQKQINIIEYVCGEQLDKLGYKLKGQSIQLNFLQKFYFNMHQKIIGELQLQIQLKKPKLNNLIKLKKRC